MAKLPKKFYTREDVIGVSKELLGKFIYTDIGGKLTGGMIVETEAYHGAEDRASHAFGNRKTPRTEPFFKEGGISYVYLCYGIHYLFNIITNKKDVPHAILIRAIEPTEGVETMLHRRRMTKPLYNLTAGPGAMSMALGITTKHNAVNLQGNIIWLEDKDIKFKEEDIIASPRVGVAYAKEDASKPWRFRVKGSLWTSKAK
ncbi:MAG TPA: DNA-3-methyladenine glycosylase [Cytophagaceae bacterium]|jgi:DNA-3-methyladenine glycosylase|nr:DNA-3-methyladenine glycosylase [Cytophagaceae bacterium]